jgi:signal transduction histidine kinase
MKSQPKLSNSWLPRLGAGFPLRNLRTQLFLWIALPATMVLLALSLVQIYSHTHAMRQLVQARADSLVQAVAALVSVRIQHSAETLAQVATIVATGAGRLTASASFFPAGLALYNTDGTVLERTGAGDWPVQPSVKALAATTASRGIAGAVTVQETTTGRWLLVQAAPAPDDPPLAILGATPVEALVRQEFIRPLSPSQDSELHVEDADGHTLLELAGGHSDERTIPRTVTAQAVVTPTYWRIVLRESWETLVPFVLRFDIALLVVLCVAVALALLSAYFGFRRIIQPLQQLHAAAGQVGHGDVAPLRQPLGGVAEIEALRIALAHMADQVQQYQQLLHHYIDAITLGQEEERKRLARDLHDDTVQALIALNQQVELAAKELTHVPQQAAERLDKLRPLLAAAIASLRRHIQNLRPLYLEDLGFESALEMLVRQISGQHNLVGDFELKGQPRRPLSPALEITAYRIVQEAVQNVARHAHARWVHVEFIFDSAGVTLRIEDDGIGFQTPAPLYDLVRAGHYGLLGIQERTQLHGGRFGLTSEPGQGTTLTVWLPTYPTSAASASVSPASVISSHS